MPILPSGGVLQERPDPRWRTVDSTCLSAIRYVGEGWLDVRFRKSGKQYRYFGVPVEEFWLLLYAPSVGTRYNAAIKDQYEWTEI